MATTPATDEGGRPDFAGFVAALREEADWVQRIHAPDKTGQAGSDSRTLMALAAYVTSVGRRLGYMAPERDSNAIRCSGLSPEDWEDLREQMRREPPPPDFQYTEDRETDFYRAAVPAPGVAVATIDDDDAEERR